MVVHSIYFDTLGHTAAEKNLQAYLPHFYSDVTYRTTTLSEIKQLIGWKGKILSLLAYPFLSKFKYDIGFNRFRNEFAYSLMVYWYFKRLDKTGIDVFHFRTQSICFLVQRFFSRYHVIVTIDMTTKQLIALRPYNKLFYAPIIWFENKVFNSGAIIACYSQHTTNAVIDGYNVTSEKVRCIYPSVRQDFFNIKRTFSVPALPTILFVGNDFKRKGGDLLLKVFAKHFKDKAELLIVSNDPFIDGLEKSKNVHFHRNVKPNTSELIDLFSSATIFVMPTREEAYGIVFSEAMAAGLPCIGTRTMAIPELIEDGKDGYLMEIDDEKGLKETMDTLLDNPDLVQQFGLRAREKAFLRYCLTTFLEKYMQIFK